MVFSMFNHVFRSTKLQKTSLSSLGTCQKRLRHDIRVILTEDLPDGKGYAGEVHQLKAGYARNYLIPLKKALYATPHNFERVGMKDPDLLTQSIEEKRSTENREGEQDKKEADFLRHYLRNKTLKIWRNIDKNALGGSDSKIDGLGIPIYPGMVDHKAVREKLSKQLNIDLEEHEKVQIYSKPVSHSLMDDPKMVDKLLDQVPSLNEGEQCETKIKALGEFLVKIHLRGGQNVALRLAVLKR